MTVKLEWPLIKSVVTDFLNTPKKVCVDLHPERLLVLSVIEERHAVIKLGENNVKASLFCC